MLATLRLPGSELSSKGRLGKHYISYAHCAHPRKPFGMSSSTVRLVVTPDSNSEAMRSPCPNEPPLLNRCCCGSVTLRSGTLCIGLICMVDSVTGFLLTTSLYDTANNLLPFPDEEVIKEEDEFEIKLVFLIVSGLVDLIQCVFSVLLFYGAKEQRNWFFLPWIVLYCMGVPVSLSLGFIFTAAFFIFGFSLVGVAVFTYCLLTNVIPAYFLLVVISYYRELQVNGPQDPALSKEVFAFPRRYSKEHTDPSACV